MAAVEIQFANCGGTNPPGGGSAVAAALGRVAYELGEDDEAELVEAFPATLAPRRAATLLSAPVVNEILSLVKA